MPRIALLALLALAACLPSMPDKIDGPATPVRLTAKGQKLQPVMMTALTVRVFENTGTKRIRLEERHSATCKLSSPYFNATVTAPARVAIPDYDARPLSTPISCPLNGTTHTRHPST
jgi:hypothetical protein